MRQRSKHNGDNNNQSFIIMMQLTLTQFNEAQACVNCADMDFIFLRSSIMTCIWYNKCACIASISVNPFIKSNNLNYVETIVVNVVVNALFILN